MKRTIATKSGGIHIELTPEEEEATRAEWAKNERLKEQEDLIKDQKKALKKEKQDSLMARLNLSQEEFDLIRNS